MTSRLVKDIVAWPPVVWVHGGKNGIVNPSRAIIESAQIRGQCIALIVKCDGKIFNTSIAVENDTNRQQIFQALSAASGTNLLEAGNLEL